MSKKEHSVNTHKEEALKDLFKSLKISLKNASIYFSEHPAFVKSIEEMKKKIDALLNFISPIKIGFTSHSLLVEGEYLEKERIYEELAEIFHFRKIKSIEMREGITVEELKFFLKKLYLSPKDILREGGLSNLLKKEGVSYLSVEELDYSQLLKGEGEEVKDIWIYLLQDVVENEDIEKINEFVNDFEKIMGEFEIGDFIEDEKLRENMSRFFTYLREKAKDKYRKCAKDFIKALLRDKSISLETKIDELKIFFQDLSGDDIASTLWEEIITAKHFDTMSFNIFFNLIAKDKHKEVANSLAEIIRKQDSLSRTPQIEEKIRELFYDTSSPIVSEIYRRTLSFFLKEISFDQKLTFDQKHLRRNYRFVLIRLLEEEKIKNILVSILEKISKEWERIINERDLECLKFLLETLNKKRLDLVSEPKFIEVNKLISDFIESAILEGEISPEYEYFINNLRKSSLGIDYYLEKIFIENKVTPHILQSFFNFFPYDLHIFYKKLNEKSSHTEFLDRMIESLKMIDSLLSLEVLKDIYSIGSHLIKLKILRAMHQLSEYDGSFLITVLKKGDFALKKEALMILGKNDSTRHQALETMFFLPSPFGIKNKVLHENIRIIEENGFPEAKDYLAPLSRKKFFWNRKLREHALKALEK